MKFENSFDRAKEEELEELADFFSLFADSTRIKILSALDKAPLCADVARYFQDSRRSSAAEAESCPSGQIVQRVQKNNVHSR